MMRHDGAALRVLYIGGTGTISTSCVRLSVESGMSVFVLNRGNNSAARELPEGVIWLTGDVTDDASLLAAIGDQRFDAVVNFLSYDADDVRRMVAMFGSRTRQYVHISSGSIYAKPVQQSPISESTPIAPNPVLDYATAKWRAELALQQALTEQGFPVTIVRPSHTYDDANPPVPGGWTVVDRIARGAEIPVHGDGTSLWTLTHAEDFAQGLVGLLGNPRSHRGGLQHHRRGRLHLGPDLHHHRRRTRRRGQARARGLRVVPSGGTRLVLVGRGARRHRPLRGVRHQQDPAVRTRLRAEADVPPGCAAHGPVAGGPPGHDRR